MRVVSQTPGRGVRTRHLVGSQIARDDSSGIPVSSTMGQAVCAHGLDVTSGYDYGSLLADGSINREQNAIARNAQRDTDLLEGMRARFGSDAPILSRRKIVSGGRRWMTEHGTLPTCIGPGWRRPQLLKRRGCR